MNALEGLAPQREKMVKSRVIGLRVASIVFGVISVAHLARLFIRLKIQVAGHPIPLWPSALAFVVLGALSLWLWNLAGSSPDDSQAKP